MGESSECPLWYYLSVSLEDPLAHLIFFILRRAKTLAKLLLEVWKGGFVLSEVTLLIPPEVAKI